MIKICPISDRKVNEKVTRMNAFFTFSFAILFLITGNYWFLSLLTFDYALRLLVEGKLNPFILINTFILNKMNSKKILINAGPKIFAARIGLSLTVLSVIFYFSGLNVASMVTMGILATFSFLEFAFNLCVACKLYPYALLLNEISIK